MLLGGKSYAIATRKLGNRKMIALRLTFCSIFPISLFWKSGKMEQFYHYDHYKNLDCEANNNTRSIAL